MPNDRYRIRLVLEDQLLGMHISETRHEAGTDKDEAAEFFRHCNALIAAGAEDFDWQDDKEITHGES